MLGLSSIKNQRYLNGFDPFNMLKIIL